MFRYLCSHRVVVLAAGALVAGCAASPPAPILNAVLFYDCIGPFIDSEPCSEDHPSSRIVSADGTRRGTTAAAAALREAAAPGFGAETAPVRTSSLRRIDGAAAGDVPEGVSLWMSGSGTKADNDFAPTRYEAVTDVLMAGVDYQFNERLLAGLSVGRESTELSTAFNAGRQDVDGLILAAYAGYRLSEHYSLDAAVGVTHMDLKQSRTDPFSAPLVRDNVSGATDARRWFVAANGNAGYRLGDWALSGRVGLLFARERQDAFTETGGSPGAGGFVASQRIDFGQLQLGAEIAYTGWLLEPYALLGWEHDFEHEVVRLNASQPQPPNDDSNYRAGLGLRYFHDALATSFQYERTGGRDSIDTETLSFFLSYSF